MQGAPAALPFGIPGIGDEIDGAMQHAPQAARQSESMISSGMPHILPEPTHYKVMILQTLQQTACHAMQSNFLPILTTILTIPALAHTLLTRQ